MEDIIRQNVFVNYKTKKINKNYKYFFKNFLFFLDGSCYINL